MLLYDLAKCLVTVSIAGLLVSCVSSSPHAVAPPHREVFLSDRSSSATNDDLSTGYYCYVKNLQTHQVFHAQAAQRNVALKQARSLCMAGQFARSCSVKFDCAPM